MAKPMLTAVNAALALLIAVGAYFAPAGYWQSLLVNLATVFFGAALAIVVVNIYLERDSRRKAVGALLRLATDGIADFHNTFLDLMWGKFGKDDFGQLRERFKNARGDIMVLNQEQRRAIYDMGKQHHAKLTPLLEKLDQVLAEVTSLVGWSLDSTLLTQVLQGRNAIRRFRSITLDDSDQAINEAAEHLIDIDTFSASAYHILKALSGTRPE